MRLTVTEVDSIRQMTPRFFGAGSRVWLFGSRTDDQARGGDIDLYIRPMIDDPKALMEAKLGFLVEIKRRLGDRKIDVVIHRASSDVSLPIYRIAEETGVELL